MKKHKREHFEERNVSILWREFRRIYAEKPVMLFLFVVLFVFVRYCCDRQLNCKICCISYCYNFLFFLQVKMFLFDAMTPVFRWEREKGLFYLFCVSLLIFFFFPSLVLQDLSLSFSFSFILSHSDEKWWQEVVIVTMKEERKRKRKNEWKWKRNEREKKRWQKYSEDSQTHLVFVFFLLASFSSVFALTLSIFFGYSFFYLPSSDTFFCREKSELLFLRRFVVFRQFFLPRSLCFLSFLVCLLVVVVGLFSSVVQTEQKWLFFFVLYS